MIKKEKLLKQIELLEMLERRAAPLLSKHVSSTLFFSEIKKDERDKILEKFQSAIVSQTKHMEIIKQIKTEVSKSKKDVY